MKSLLKYLLIGVLLYLGYKWLTRPKVVDEQADQPIPKKDIPGHGDV